MPLAYFFLVISSATLLFNKNPLDGTCFEKIKEKIADSFFPAVVTRWQKLSTACTSERNTRILLGVKDVSLNWVTCEAKEKKYKNSILVLLYNILRDLSVNIRVLFLMRASQTFFWSSTVDIEKKYRWTSLLNKKTKITVRRSFGHFTSSIIPTCV